MKSMLAAAALIAGALAAPAALAKEPRTHAVALSTADLDVRKPEDAAAFVRRIETAMRPFCVHNTAYETIGSCVRDVTRSAINQLGIPELGQALERPAPALSLAQR